MAKAASKSTKAKFKPDDLYRVGLSGPLAGSVRKGPPPMEIGRFQVGDTVEYTDAKGHRYLRTTVIDTVLGKLYFHHGSIDGTVVDNTNLDSMIDTKA